MISEDADIVEDLKCSCFHLDTSSYKEERDKRYFKIEECKLFGTRCASCEILFPVEITTGNDELIS